MTNLKFAVILLTIKGIFDEIDRKTRAQKKNRTNRHIFVGSVFPYVCYWRAFRLFHTTATRLADYDFGHFAVFAVWRFCTYLRKT